MVRLNIIRITIQCLFWSAVNIKLLFLLYFICAAPIARSHSIYSSAERLSLSRFFHPLSVSLVCFFSARQFVPNALEKFFLFIFCLSALTPFCHAIHFYLRHWARRCWLRNMSLWPIELDFKSPSFRWYSHGWDNEETKRKIDNR